MKTSQFINNIPEDIRLSPLGHCKPLSELVLDPRVWEANGRVEGWGEWTIPHTKFEHDFELDHFEPDTAKTPVHFCKKCYARKINNIITWDNSCEYPEEWESEPKKWHQMTAHGSKKLNSWQEKFLGLPQARIDGKTIEEYISTL